jgi:restriction system protein
MRIEKRSDWIQNRSVPRLHQKVILIDGRRLAELMIDHGIGVAEEHAYHVKKIDSDYFEEG